MQSNFEKLSASVQAMAELLNENMPELPKDEEDPIKGMVLENGKFNLIRRMKFVYKNVFPVVFR